MRFRTPDFNPSRLFLYYNERDIEGSESTDSGAMLSDGVKSLQQQGVCPELAWVYDIKRFAEKPPQSCYKLAEDHKYHRGYNIDNTDIEQIKVSLFNGNPFVMGIAVYASFESQEVAQTGTVPMPGPDEAALGGHAILCCGYDDSTQRVTCLNSWSEQWGDHGYFTLPYAYVTDP